MFRESESWSQPHGFFSTTTSLDACKLTHGIGIKLDILNKDLLVKYDNSTSLANFYTKLTRRFFIGEGGFL